MTLKQLYLHFAQSPDAAWIVRHYNALLLYDFVKNNNFKRILDLGTGIGLSASIIALALKDSGKKPEDCQVDSIEQFDKCIKIAEKLIPGELKPYIKIHKANVVPWQMEKVRYSFYSTYDLLPDEQYDFIFNDGPAPWNEGEVWCDLPNGTIAKMLIENKLKPGTFIAFDGRLLALRDLERYFSDNFYLAKPAPPGTDFNILERKDNEVKFVDSKFLSIKELGYFKGIES